MTATIVITLNGASHEIASPSSLQDLIISLDLPNQAMAAAVNRTVVPRQQWQDCILQPQDTVDIVRAIGGG